MSNRDINRSRVVFAIPVAQSCMTEASLTFQEWHEMGYRTVALIDGPLQPKHCEMIRVDEYFGWAWATNILARSLHRQFDWLVAGGHDVLPESSITPQQILLECTAHFGGTFGVMQPAGDAYGALADKSACVSPWIGAEFCDRFGPLHEGYFHFWADTELMHVANNHKCLWWRDDLIQYHDHHARKPGAKGHPPHLIPADKKSKEDKSLFLRRKADNFA